MVKLGIIVRCDNGGLGILSHEHVKHLKPEKVLAVMVGRHKEYPERYPGALVSEGIPSERIVREFLSGLDVCLIFEVPYNRKLYAIAREMGVKTINQINYEWTRFHELPDLSLCPSLWRFEDVPDPKVYLPNPVSRDIVQFRLRKRANTFLHIAGHVGSGCRGVPDGRNGTFELLDAIPLVKADVRFVIYSQSDLDVPDDNRIDYRRGDFDDYASLYDEGDVYIYPRRYGGQSLPLNEALSAGLPVLMTDMEPQDRFLPQNWLMPVDTRQEIEIAQSFDMCTVTPKTIAAKIDEWAGKDIRKDSKEANRIAETLSWTTLLPRYYEMFRGVRG